MRAGWCAVTVLGACAWSQLAAAQPPAGDALERRMRTDVNMAVEAAFRQGKPADAFQAYESFAKAIGRHDDPLLGALARGVLRQVAADQVSVARISALERLAGVGDAAARRTLEEQASAGALIPEGVPADTALAAIGDARAIDRLVQRLGDDGMRDKLPLVEALATARATRAAYALVDLLRDENPANRMAAAQGLALLGTAEHVPALVAALEAETGGPLRPVVAVAIKSLGSNRADALVAELARSPVADVRVQALDAYHASKSADWQPLARQLLKSDSEGARLRAATLLGLDVPDARQEILRFATAANVAVREAGARALESAGTRDRDLLLRLLRDVSPVVRTHAAGAVLAAIGSDPRSPAAGQPAKVGPR